MFIVAILISVVSLVCWIMVLVKVFQSGKTLMGVLCICPLFAFIYGWIESGRLNIRNIMLIWTGAIVANIVLNVMMPHAVVVQSR